MNPTTEAGKRLLDDLAGDTEGTTVLVAYRSGLAHDISAIEAEAVAAALTALRERVAGMEGQCHDGEGLGCDTYPCVVNVSRAAVLAIVNREGDAMTDPRLAALGAALHHYRGTCELWTISEAA